MQPTPSSEDATEPKTCFVIGPIGAQGSPTRIRADEVFNALIRPVAEARDYLVVRADRISESGSISVQIMEHLLEAELVIADLGELNPNVMYELAIRHGTEKPFVQVYDDGTPTGPIPSTGS